MSTIKPKLKICTRCSKEKPVWSNIKGKPYCESCSKKEKADIAKEKRKIKREKKREVITEKKLDTVFSKLVRTIYPWFCHSSKVPIEVEGSHCAHLVSRKNRCVRFDLRNCYPTTPQENMFNQLHVIQLAKRLKEYYGIDIEDWEQATKQSTCKLSSIDRKEMFEIFSIGLEDAWMIRNGGYKTEERLQELRLEIISKTKKVM